MVTNLEELFEKYEDDHIKFERVSAEDRKGINSADLVAFNLLYSIMPPDGDIVGGASYDEIYLYPNLEALAKVITEEQVLTLIRCGVRLDIDNDSLCMFV